MTFPVTINGNVYAESDFINYGHLTNFPNIVEDVATVGAAADVAATEAKTAGGYSYEFDNGTADADPGTGRLRFNHATVASATAIYISETTEAAQAIAAIIQAWDDSTSTIKGFLKVFKQSDLTTFALFSLSGTITDSGTYDALAVTYIAGSGTFTNDDLIGVSFVRNGDKGDTGSTGAAGAGDVNGPVSSSDNGVPRFDGTGGKTLQTSKLSVSDTGTITINDGTYNLDIVPTGLSADRSVSIGNVSGSLLTSTTTATITNKTLGSGTALGAELDGSSYGMKATFRSFVTLDAAQTFAAGDAGVLQRLNGSTNRIWTIPTNAAVAFGSGTEIDVFNDGTAVLTLTADTGVVINGVTAGSITLSANQGGVLKKVDTDRWIYMGDNKTAWA